MPETSDYQRGWEAALKRVLLVLPTEKVHEPVADYWHGFNDGIATAIEVANEAGGWD